MWRISLARRLDTEPNEPPDRHGTGPVRHDPFSVRPTRHEC
jgi:hypothetical protein